MDDLSEKLTGILNDPESMERVRKMAESIFSGEDNGQNSVTKNENPLADAAQIQSIMSIVSKFNSLGDDKRSQLINALKPYLSEHRQEKADAAIKILKLLEILPLLKDSGIF